MKRYDPSTIEPKWQEAWEASDLFKTSQAAANKAYVLDMFPYPSGDGLHVGHPRGYTATDVYAHYLRMTGRPVLHPMGWDAFGLPAENAAIKKGVPPAANTAGNIANFRRQLKRLGYSYDWSREVNTSDPVFYRWTQWLFLQLHQAGLAYQASGWQWWCPNDKTVLANEQVVDGHCERCGSEVTKKELTQWFFKTTKYAAELYDQVAALDWPDKIKAMQRNWIGKSEGAEIVFKAKPGPITVYTTRPDTLFGATYLVLAPEHRLVSRLTTKAQQAAVDAYIEQAKRASDIERTAEGKDKTGVFTGSYATNPATGEDIPIWVADYVLASYSTGAIMAVPAHDQRDLQFARTFDLPVRPVIEPQFGEAQGDEINKDKIIAIVRNPKTKQILLLDWGPRQQRTAGVMLIGGGMEPGEDAEQAARREIAEETGYTDLTLVATAPVRGHGYFYSNVKQQNVYGHCHGLLFELASSARSKQRLDHREDQFELRWVDQKDVLGQLDDGIHQAFYAMLGLDQPYTGEGVMTHSGAYDGMSTSEAREKIVADLAKQHVAKPATGFKLRDWLISRQRYWGTPIPIIHCDSCGAVPVPEDQLPVVLPEIDDYLPTGDGRSPLAKVDQFVQTKCPQCGQPAQRETDTMDTFVDSSWYFLRYVSPSDDTQPFDPDQTKQWLPVDSYVGGAEHAVLHLIYARFITKVLADQRLLDFREPFTRLRNQGLIHAADGHKMSKSKGNVVNPDEIVAAFGADTLRVYELFIGPFEQRADWSTRTIEGVYRYLKRVWTFAQTLPDDPVSPDQVAQTAVDRAVNQAVADVTRQIQHFRFNTVVSTLMETLNTLSELKAGDGVPAWRAAWETYLVLLAPLAPHLAEELWHQLGNAQSVLSQPWPKYDPALAAEDTVPIVVQVNGKLRATIVAAAEASQAEVVKLALLEPNVAAYATTDTIRKQIFVPGKLLNLVV